MRHLALSILLVLFSLTWVSAQQDDTATPANDPAAIPNSKATTPQNDSPNSTDPNRGDNAKSSNADQKTMEGCLSGSSGAYLLTAQSGTVYRLVGNTDGLSKYVGKEVRIQGSKGSASDVSTGTSSSSGGSSGVATSNPTAGAEPEIQVSSANVISETCKNSGK